jgi:hypothetical protein
LFLSVRHYVEFVAGTLVPFYRACQLPFPCAC